MRIHASVFGEARVVACTLSGAANKLLFRQHFATLFIDEAAQALEAACWIAIRKADRVIFAGDHCQLPPPIKCIEAARGGLDQTLMEKVVTNKPVSVSLLKVQYRMNEAIMRFPSEWFYNNQLESAPEVRHRGILDYDTPMVWIDTSELEFHEEFVGESFGRINKPEADLLIQELKNYIQRIGENRVFDERIDFGLISPYKAQVQYLRNKIKSSSFFRPFRELITINTVDGFQGQERDVIFISLVRANENGQIGFLNDLRRMNVAITRARMKLVILGEAQTLTRHAFYKKLMEYDDVDLEFTDDALNAIADKAIERNIGARGLRAVMEGLLTKIMYEIPSDKTVVKAVVTKDCVEGKAEPELTHDSNKINYSVKLNTGKSEARNEADTPMSAS